MVRVTADLSVRDGPDYEVLGLNLRGMVKTIFDDYAAPAMDSIERVANDIWNAAEDTIRQELDQQIYNAGAKPQEQPAQQPARQPTHTVSQNRTATLSSLWSWWRSIWFDQKKEGQDTRSEQQTAMGLVQPVELQALEAWKQALGTATDPLYRACLEALIKVVGTMVAQRGRLVADQELLITLCARRVANDHGSESIGVALEPLFQQAVDAQGYRVLPARTKPVIMNVKGASAAGKSTIRPQQRELAETLGIPWEDFALISPDYWRKYLLDYESLGDERKYGAMLTGQELELIDRKLDRYMAAKAASGKMTHLLIDRFRFDSFTLKNGRTSDSQLLTRFGDRIFLFFMITPPAETVVRAWNRGLTTGRYKAVDDLLYHNVEAYTGMPALFLSWSQSEEKRVHFEFLDNDVALGETPRTAAHGWGKTMIIIDVDVMINIDRYRKVNVDARSADTVFSDVDNGTLNNLSFIERCAENLDFIEFVDRHSQEPYAQVVKGKLVWWDAHFLQQLDPDDSVYLTLQSLGYRASQASGPRHDRPAYLEDTDTEYRLGH